MQHQRTTAEESPVEGYERHRQNYRACVDGCSRRFLSLQTSDEALHKLQSDLYDQLLEADTIWDKLKASREQSGTRKKCAAQMQAVVDALKMNLKEQESALATIGQEMAELRASLDDYCQMTEESKLEHKHLTAALDQKVKEMKRDIRAMLPVQRGTDLAPEAAASPRARSGAKEAEGKKRTRSNSPSRTRASPRQSK